MGRVGSVDEALHGGRRDYAEGVPCKRVYNRLITTKRTQLYAYDSSKQPSLSPKDMITTEKKQPLVFCATTVTAALQQ